MGKINLTIQAQINIPQGMDESDIERFMEWLQTRGAAEIDKSFLELTSIKVESVFNFNLVNPFTLGSYSFSQGEAGPEFPFGGNMGNGGIRMPVVEPC